MNLSFAFDLLFVQSRSYRFAALTAMVRVLWEVVRVVGKDERYYSSFGFAQLSHHGNS